MITIFPRNGSVRLANLLKVLNDSAVAEFIDYMKLFKSAVFADFARNAIDHCLRHGDYTKIAQCLEIAKHTEYYRSCLWYFEENSIASFAIHADRVDITIDRAKRPLGNDLASYISSGAGSFASVVGEVSRKSDVPNEKRKPHKAKAGMVVLGKEKRAIQDMAAVLEKTPPEYRSAVYRDLARQHQDKKDEQKSAKFLSVKDELVHLRKKVSGASSKERVDLQEKISDLEKAAKRLAPKTKKAWSPVLPGSFGSKR